MNEIPSNSEHSASEENHESVTSIHSSRRRFLQAVAGVAVASATDCLCMASTLRRPNVLILTTDQQFADAMSCRIGSQFLHTPNMDHLAARSLVFRRAYSANPICMPSRASMVTGRYPVTTGIETNSRATLDAARFPSLGTLFARDGYTTAYFGKWHLPYPIQAIEAHGFAEMHADEVWANHDRNLDTRTAAEAARFLATKRSQPFLAWISFLNPHNICEWARGEALPQGPIGPPPPAIDCPPLRADHDPQKDEPDIMTLLRRSYQNNPMFPVGNFDDAKWRQYQWAYYRLIEKVDAQVGVVLQALRDNHLEQDTIVVFAADHGDCQGAHRWNQKTVFYEESTRVPFLLSYPGVVRTGVSDHLVNTGIDLVPTLCSLAGIERPANGDGISLRKAATQPTMHDPRTYIVSSNDLDQGGPVDGVIPHVRGRMVRSDRYKYCVYDQGHRRESFVDLQADPGEMVNLAGDPHHHEALQQHRQMLAEWCARFDPKWPQVSVEAT
ncbi:MAG: sulfatase-like hydrolase/transferase [Acidobacteriota bacterium]